MSRMPPVRHLASTVALIAIAAGGTPASATTVPTATSASYTPIVAARPRVGASLALGKCINLSNMFEAPSEGAWGRAFRDSDINTIAAAGFTGLRLPVRFSIHAGKQAPFTIDPAFLARIRHVVDLAVAAHLHVIVDMHHYLELFDDPAGQTPRFAALWRQVAEAFKDEPDSVSFELINEPHAKLDANNLAAVIAPALAAVRASNPTRKVVIDGPQWAGLDAIDSVAMPDDPNVVPTFHYYEPQNFAMDTAPWMKPATRADFGTPTDIAYLDKRLQQAKDYMAKTGRVPFVGEYGAPTQRADGQRVGYYGTVSAAFASIGLQSCAWGYTNTYDLYRDGRGWLPGVTNAIGTTSTVR